MPDWAVLRKMVCDEQIGNALHPLPSHSHTPPNRSHGAWLIQDAAKHLPPGGGYPTVGRELLGCLQEPGIETEGGEDDLGQERAPASV